MSETGDLRPSTERKFLSFKGGCKVILTSLCVMAAFSGIEPLARAIGTARSEGITTLPISQVPHHVLALGDKEVQGKGPFRPIDVRIRSSPVLDPLNSQGDELYAIYRKGLITRHIAKNGRLLEAVALESIDDFTPDQLYEGYDGRIYIRVRRCDGSVSHGVPVENARYSEEIVPGTGGPPYPHEKRMWVPVVAPIKYPGYEDKGYNIVSGTGDNPLYYGGMALAAFSLEHMYCVSQYSIQYARKLVEFFLSSEMTGRNGYMLRRPNFFDSNRSAGGVPIIQGASVEELLGTMLGLMYYLRVEDHDHPLYSRAKALRDRILQRIPLPTTVQCTYPVSGGKHEHPFMLSRKDPSYMVGHFAFPLFASAGQALTEPAQACNPYTLFVNLADASAGWSASIGEIFADVPFNRHVMFLTATILILDSDIDIELKKNYARFFMDEYIKASTTFGGPDHAKLFGNAYMGVVGKLVNKYLNNELNSETEGRKLREIWGDNWNTWESIKASVGTKISLSQTEIANSNPSLLSPCSMHNDDWRLSDDSNRLMWQHNLPLWTPTSSDPPLGSLWTDRNPNRRIGAWFVWSHQWPFLFSKSLGRWYENFPGWSSGVPLTELEYKSGNDKKYTNRGFLEREIGEQRGHRDNQVEGAGLGLFFLRMLLTHISPQEYPPPKLPEDYDRPFNVLPVLPWLGAEAIHPQFLDYVDRYRSKNDPGGAFKIGGNQNKALRLIGLSRWDVPGYNFVVGYMDEEERLRLAPAYVATDLYLSPRSPNAVTVGRSDKFSMTRTRDPQGETVVIVADRAEESGFAFPCRDHWLRVSAWRVKGYGLGHTGCIEHLATWESDSRNCGGARDVDVSMLADDTVVVTNTTHDDKTKLHIFKLRYSTYADGSVGAKIDARKWSEGWTQAKPFTVGGQPFLFLLKEGDGAVHINRMEANGKVGAEVARYDWTSGWTTAEFHQISGATYLFLLKESGVADDDKNVHIHVINAVGAVPKIDIDAVAHLDVPSNDPWENDNSCIGAAYDRIVIVPTVEKDGSSKRFFLNSYSWDNGNLQHISRLSVAELDDNVNVAAQQRRPLNRVLDLTVVKKLDYSQPGYAGMHYAVAAVLEQSHLSVYTWEVQPDGVLVYKGRFRANREEAETHLVGSETSWESGSITPGYFSARNLLGFVIAGRAAAIELRDENGNWKQSAQGLKVVYGHILEDGRPTIWSSNVIGSGDDDAMSMIDVTGSLLSNTDGELGVVTAHKTKDGDLMLINWKYRNNFEQYSWSQ